MSSAKSTSTATENAEIPVLMHILGTQDFDETGTDKTEFVTEATMTRTPTGLMLRYHESAITGMEGTTTTFLVEPSRVTMEHSGAILSRMVFEEEKQHTSLYETPFGEMSIDVRTSRLRHNLTERGGLLELRYAIAIEHIVTGRSSVRIQVRPRSLHSPIKPSAGSVKAPAAISYKEGTL